MFSVIKPKKSNVSVPELEKTPLELTVILKLALPILNPNTKMFRFETVTWNATPPETPKCVTPVVLICKLKVPLTAMTPGIR